MEYFRTVSDLKCATRCGFGLALNFGARPAGGPVLATVRALAKQRVRRGLKRDGQLFRVLNCGALVYGEYQSRLCD